MRLKSSNSTHEKQNKSKCLLCFHCMYICERKKRDIICSYFLGALDMFMSCLRACTSCQVAILIAYSRGIILVGTRST